MLETTRQLNGSIVLGITNRPTIRRIRLQAASPVNRRAELYTARIRRAAAGLLLLLAASPVVSHHSVAMFDLDVELVVRGTVARFDYAPPHAHLFVVVENRDGGTTEWDFELDAPVQLEHLGVGVDFFRPGETIVARISPAKDGRPVGFLAGAVTSRGSSFRDAEGLDD